MAKQPIQAPATSKRSLGALPRSIWILGFGSMFMDISSELVHSLLPILLSTVLGASMVTIGLLEGVAEATAAITKIFSGVISDYFRRRKFLVVLGYALSTVTKPVFPLATSVSWIFGARFIDRIGKGIRGAPRDALIADIVTAERRGAAYGLRQALDTVGAFVGPLIAVLCMVWLVNDIQTTLWVAVVPATIAVFLLLVGVREPDRPPATAADSQRWSLFDAKRLHSRFWLVVALGALFTLARFSEAFLILRATDTGLAIAYAPVIMIVMNVVYAVFAYPAGAASDRLPAHKLLMAGLAILVISDLVLAVATSPLLAFAGAILWGLHMALTQGLMSKLVADTAPPELRGTAFGIFNLVSGVALLLASVIAGVLWQIYGAPTTFIGGAVFATLAVGGLMVYPRTSRIDPP